MAGFTRHCCRYLSRLPKLTQPTTYLQQSAIRQQKVQLSTSSRLSGVFEPDGLDDPPEIPEYDCLNIRLRGYDYTVLESFAKYVHNLSDSFDIKTECWPVPAKTLDVKTFKPNSTIVENSIDLAVYERTIEINDVPSTSLPLLCEVIHTHLPEGVSLAVKEPEEEEEENLYVPDLLMEELQSQIEELDKAKDERRKK